MSKRRDSYKRIGETQVSTGKWCDHCKCESCQAGTWGIRSIQNIELEDGTHICCVCLCDEPWDGCKSEGDSSQCDAWIISGCCEHRPKIKPGAQWQPNPNPEFQPLIDGMS